MRKYVFVLGGVISSVGKGISASSIAALLKSYGYKVRQKKLDPYLNIDPGTMSPYQHGEVFVTADGAETDLDLGHYERFLVRHLTKNDSVSGGKIYHNVLTKERKGEYKGATVQAIPHVSDEIKNFMLSDLTDEDIVIYEIGGTVGDIEGLMFVEAARQFANDVGRNNVLFVYLTLLPYISTAGELKTKPTQHAVKTLLSLGIQAQILICRTNHPLSEHDKKKLALFCNIDQEDVFSGEDVDNIYRIPLLYHEQGVDRSILKHLGLPYEGVEPNLKDWLDLIYSIDNSKEVVNIGIVGKYSDFAETYKSLTEALKHAGWKSLHSVNINWIDSSNLKELYEKDLDVIFKSIDGVIVPGGFGGRGVEGKLVAIRYARDKKIPILGICLGMQAMVIEATRSFLGISDANSTEFSSECSPVVFESQNIVDSYYEKNQEGSRFTRLGEYPIDITPDSLAMRIYSKPSVRERHRHSYEINISLCAPLEEKGFLFSGKSPDKKHIEIIEYKDHPFYIGVQFHPEFASNPFDAHPVFLSFIEASLKNKNKG